MPINSFDNYKMSWKPKLNDYTPPIYKTLSNLLKEDIKNGTLKPGDKMPPQRELADYLDLNLSTITRTYNLCLKEGLLTGKVGQGTYVSIGANVSDILLLPNKEGQIALDTIRPLYTYNDRIMEEIKNILNKPDSYHLLEYHTIEDNIYYQKSIAEFLKNYNETIDYQEVLFATGGQNALCGILLGLLDPNDTIATNEYSFPALKGICKLLHIKLVSIPEIDNKIDFQKLNQLIKQQSIKALYLIPDIHNPTTYTLSLEERKILSDIVLSNHIFIIEDVINKFLMNDSIPSFKTIIPSNTVEIVSISKFLVPGLRICYVITPKHFKDKLKNAFYNMNLMVSPLNLEIVTRLINSPLTKEIIKKRRIELKERNSLVNTIFKDYDIKGNYNCTFRWLVLPPNINSKLVGEECSKRNVLIFTEEMFSIGVKKNINAIRICVSSPKTIEELERGLNVILEVIKGIEKSIG